MAQFLLIRFIWKNILHPGKKILLPKCKNALAGKKQGMQD